MRRRVLSQGDLRTRPVHRGLSRTDASYVRRSKLVPGVRYHRLRTVSTITHNSYAVVPPIRMIWMVLRRYCVPESIPSS